MRAEATTRIEMENVPKIVKQRLEAGSTLVDHPDADVLTAFSERALPEREQARVLEHMARCAQCREVIALALPSEELAAVIQAPPGKWFTWPRLRWGLVAAGVIVVGSFGVLRYQQGRGPADIASYKSAREDGIAKEAKNHPEPVPAAEEAPEPQKGAIPPAKSSAVAGKRREADTGGMKSFDRLEEFAKLQPTQRAAPGVGDIVGGRVRPQTLSHGPKPPTQQWQQSNGLYTNSNNQWQAPAAPPVANQSASNAMTAVAQPAPSPKAGGEIAGTLVVDKQAQNADSVALNGRSLSALSPPAGSAGADVARSKDPAINAPKAAPSAYDVSAAYSNFSPSGSLVPESARWSINSVGGLQRSLDQGKTWEDVDVNKGLQESGATNLQLAMKSRARAETKEKADLKSKPIVFRAVSANGPDVWAGGSEGTLYHSTDAGGHWLRIVPSWRGIELTGDILNLQFADTQRGRIVTSAAEIWLTADGGQTWDKQ